MRFRDGTREEHKQNANATKQQQQQPNKEMKKNKASIKIKCTMCKYGIMHLAKNKSVYKAKDARMV